MTQINLTMTTPEKSGIKFPSGHVLVNIRWRKDGLGKDISKCIKTVYSDALGLVDFYTSESHPVVYLSETGMLTRMKECKEKVSKLNSVCDGKGTVILVRNTKTIAVFNDLQEYIALDLDIFVIPVSCQSEVPLLLYKMAMREAKSPVNSRKVSNTVPTIEDQLSILTKIPNVGNEKAKLLLERYGNIVSISEATLNSLVSTVGKKPGNRIFNFFNQSFS